ncbi:hypothetical protein BDV97DRAFT_103869 [Delphinella strobiligena]|nr:hypothetical protein BDV97DRAFT_103869 [Delphinella strobiligena]
MNNRLDRMRFISRQGAVLASICIQGIGIIRMWIGILKQVIVYLLYSFNRNHVMESQYCHRTPVQSQKAGPLQKASTVTESQHRYRKPAPLQKASTVTESQHRYRKPALLQERQQSLKASTVRVTTTTTAIHHFTIPCSRLGNLSLNNTNH